MTDEALDRQADSGAVTRNNPRLRDASALLITLAAVAIFIYLGITRYIGAGRDDQFISMWSGLQLAHGRGFVDYNFEPLEICSSLLHALILACIAWVDESHLYSLNRMCGLAASCLLFVLLFAYRKAVFGMCRYPLLPYAASVFAIALSPHFLYWTLGGLETPYAALIMTAIGMGFIAYVQTPVRWRAIAPAIALSLYCAVRPEGFFVVLFALIFVLGVWFFQGRQPGLLFIACVPAVFFLTLTGARRMWFGMFFPNPVYAKSGAFSEKIPPGINYLVNYYSSSYFALAQLLVLIALLVFFAVALVVILVKRKTVGAKFLALLFLFGLVLAYHLIVVATGGDWMEYSRFVVPVLPLLVILIVLSLFMVAERLGVAGSILALALVVVLIGTAVQRVGYDLERIIPVAVNARILSMYDPPAPSNVRALFSSWRDLDERLMALNTSATNESESLAPFYDDLLPRLHRQKGRVVIATVQMGIFPYTIRTRYPDYDLHLIDLKGICTREIAHMPLKKSSGGVSLGSSLLHIYTGEAGELSEYIQKMDPDIFYMHNLKVPGRRLLTKRGFIFEEGLGSRIIAYRP